MKRMNDATPMDRLEILRSRYEQEIRDKEGEIAVLKAKLSSLLEFAQESEKLINPEAEPDKYREMGMTSAVLDALRILSKGGRGVRPTQIRNFLLAHGYQPPTGGSNFDITVSITLRRLSESRRITRNLGADGKFFYRAIFGRITGQAINRLRLRRPFQKPA